MKYPKLTALLGLATLAFHSNLLGKNHVRLTEDQCQKLEDHLNAQPENNTEELSSLQKKFDALQKNYDALKASKSTLSTAITTALELNGLSAETENATPEEAVTLLGAKCKEYGSSTNRHSFPKNDGKQKDGNEDPSASFQHNQVMSDKSKFKTIL